MNEKRIILAAACAVALTAVAREPAATADVTVDPSMELGAIKPMNSVNNGPNVAPVLGDQKRGNFSEYKAARIPMARLHDSIGCVSGGAHAVDVSAVFPDFDADENDPKNYDFVFTDHYLDTIVRAGTKVFYRLGQTIEHGPKKYGVLPPKDYAKWARVCEHIIRHYNEGWGWGLDTARTTRNVAFSNQFNVVYWEIWNEADLDVSDDPANPPAGPRTWGGTVTNFFNFYETAAKHLKATFPDLKIGGPAMAGNEKWGERFLRYCEDTKTPLDFFSWHIYAREPGDVAAMCKRMRKMMDRHGFAASESILNEWNYVKGWGDDFVYSLEVESGRFNQKCAAFIAATMIDCQQVPLDHLMFYDARTSTVMNGIFDRTTLWPMKGYYPYLAWHALLSRGTQIACDVKGNGQFRAVAAKGKDARLTVMVARYSDDNNETDTASVTVRIPNVDFTGARCYLTDAIRTYTYTPLSDAGRGSARLFMQPNSFALIEID
ncbi:MAG TPA: hypothetical protein PKM57_09050 [Kiritimatiellia bacterium]|nr:hypothetical protein [Kiritimatiellia bacterium]HPS09092.1 hypothetical protein [Kiritimatiellia bacterium]